MTLPRRISVAILVSLCLVSAAKKKPAPPPTPTGTLAGKVFSKSAAIIPDATVHVWQGKKDITTIRPDEKGEFRFPIAEGTYEVQPAAPNRLPAVQVRITVVIHAQRETWVNLEMVP